MTTLRKLLETAIAQEARAVILNENGTAPAVQFRMPDGNLQTQAIGGHTEAFDALGFAAAFEPDEGAGYVVLDDRRIEYQAAIVTHNSPGRRFGWTAVFHVNNKPPVAATRYRPDITL